MCNTFKFDITQKGQLIVDKQGTVLNRIQSKHNKEPEATQQTPHTQT